MALLQGAGQNRGLRQLDLSSNRFTGSACESIKEMLKSAPKLRVLSVACNQLGHSGGRLLLEGIKASKSIKKVLNHHPEALVGSFSAVSVLPSSSAPCRWTQD